MIRFNDGTEVQTMTIAAGPEVLRGHRRDVVTITAPGIDYMTAAALFADGARWSIVQTGEDGAEQVFDWTRNYTMAGPITDNRDGTLVIKMGRANTETEDLQDQLAAARAQAAEQAEVVAILTGEGGTTVE